MSTNEQPWSSLKEIEAEQVPATRRSAVWATAYRELVLRLEQTTRKFALVLEFESPNESKNAAACLRRHFVKHKGPRSVTISTRGSVLYIRRGENWSK